MSFSERTIQLLGEENYEILKNSCVLVVGLGGVGGTALEALARTGVGSFVLIDKDVVDPSNLNRQILYGREDIGKNKTDAAKNRILSINPDAKIETINTIFCKNEINLLNQFKIDFAIDAIDDINGKLDFIEYCEGNNIKFISSLGMGNRMDPSKVFVTKLNKTTSDPLARKLRYSCKERGLDISLINVVFSSEEPLVKGRNISSVMTAPSAAGLNICYFTIKNLISNVE